MKDDPIRGDPGVKRAEDRYPEGGLILRVTSRDLPRPGRRDDARWNKDTAWFRKQEARELFAQDPRVGARHEVPRKLVERLVRFHLVDNVRGQVREFPAEGVIRAELAATVTAVEDSVVSIRFEGETQADTEGRGYRPRILGRARYDTNEARFVSFEMLAVGDRWGADLHNSRRNDQDPSPMGIYFSLAGDGSADRLAPALVHAYEW